jgi:hypothetical protein
MDRCSAWAILVCHRSSSLTEENIEMIIGDYIAAVVTLSDQMDMISIGGRE